MSKASNYLENKITDLLFRGQSFTPPASIYISLHTADPLDDGSGAEVSGGSYARVALVASLANWSGTQGAGTTVASSGTGGTSSNNVAITFPSPTADWGVITHFAIWDASTSGNLIQHGVLGTSKTVNNGDAAPTFPIGTLIASVA